MEHEYTERYGMINIYKCRKCNFDTVTINTDEGVTQFAIFCKQCGHPEAYSVMYRCCQHLEPHFEWFRPTEGEVQEISQKEYDGLTDEQRTQTQLTVERLVEMNTHFAKNSGMFLRPVQTTIILGKSILKLRSG